MRVRMEGEGRGEGDNIGVRDAVVWYAVNHRLGAGSSMSGRAAHVYTAWSAGGHQACAYEQTVRLCGAKGGRAASTRTGALWQDMGSVGSVSAFLFPFLSYVGPDMYTRFYTRGKYIFVT